jgi:Transposase DDE domain
MFSYPDTGRQPTFADVLHGFAQDPALPFGNVLPEQQILNLATEEGVDFGNGPHDVYTPPVVVFAWLAQCLSASKSCVAAVARVIVLRIAMGLEPCSAATGAYCLARAKLPERFVQRLTLQVGTAVEDEAPDAWRWKRRRVLLLDGFTASMPDTPENQAEYPQSRSQRPGLGFPMIRVVVLLTFATACLTGCAMGPCKGKETGETALFRQLVKQIRSGDVVVADRYFCSYWHMALLRECGADGCARMHQRRKYDFRRGERLGRGDHVVEWCKPARPTWMDEETYAAFPDTLKIREVRVHVTTPGCRSEEIIIATTLLDAKTYSKDDIADLYHHRWHVELDIRAIKQTLKMDVLTCQSPEMVRKEMWMHLLAYNLVRTVMAQAALQQGKTPRGLSFAGAQQTLDAFRWMLLLSEGQGWLRFVRALAVAVGTHEVGDRPGRTEPRAVKRRPRKYPLLRQPRQQAREALMGSAA